MFVNSVNARISAGGAYSIFLGERPRGRLFEEAGRLFRLSIFSLKITLSLFLFKTKLQHKNSKTFIENYFLQTRGNGALITNFKP